MKGYTAHEQEKLKSLDFYWNETSQEFFSDAWDNEMGVYRDCHDQHFVLRTRVWNDEDCEFEDTYDHFNNFDELVAYLS